MKKFILFILVCLAGVPLTSAQDCPLCGDWKGIYQMETDKGTVTIKITLRIRENDGEYDVRRKSEYTDGSVYYDNFEEYKMEYSENEPNFLGWYKFIYSDDEPGYFRQKLYYENTDQVVYDRTYYYKTDVYMVYNATVKGNKMIHKQWWAYNRMGKLSHSEEYYKLGTEKEVERTYTLYKDDDDW